MAIRIGGTDVVDDSRKGIFQSANVGTFANPARPGSAAVGDLIWSTTDNQLQVWNGSAWVAAVGAGNVVSASGGSEFTIDGWKVHVFTTTSTFTLNNNAELEYFIVAGGGAGGYLGGPFWPARPVQAGGGGGGGVVKGRANFNAGTFTITVGGGGGGGPTNNPAPGGNSSIAHPGGTITAIGGGAGGLRSSSGPFDGDPGGSGGGAGGNGFSYGGGGSGTPGQGKPGGPAYGYQVSPTQGASAAGRGGGWASPGNAPFPNTPSGSYFPQQVNYYYAGVGYVNTWDLPPSYGALSGANFTLPPNVYPQPGLNPAEANPESSFYAYGGGSTNFLGGPALASWAPGSGSPPYPSNSGMGGRGGTPGENGYGGLVAIRYRTIQ